MFYAGAEDSTEVFGEWGKRRSEGGATQASGVTRKATEDSTEVLESGGSGEAKACTQASGGTGKATEDSTEVFGEWGKRRSEGGATQAIRKATEDSTEVFGEWRKRRSDGGATQATRKATEDSTEVFGEWGKRRSDGGATQATRKATEDSTEVLESESVGVRLGRELSCEAGPGRLLYVSHGVSGSLSHHFLSSFASAAVRRRWRCRTTFGKSLNQIR